MSITMSEQQEILAKLKMVTGGGMKKILKVLLLFVLLAVPAAAQEELVDPKTGEYTPHGVVASLIAGAQVTEMRCGMKGQITAALAKANRLGLPFDLNQKENYSDVVFLATQLMTRIGAKGFAVWCRDTAPNLAKLLQTP